MQQYIEKLGGQLTWHSYNIIIMYVISYMYLSDSKESEKKIKAIFVHAEFWPNTVYLCDLQAQMRFDITRSRIVSYYSWSTNNYQ